ncbi:response regulator [Paenibacillus sp. GCM10012303]|uniref:response regulator n=1 Tax=Paenibacillus sp. GCM10012303 TaxID=3317340 RepID=UPI003616ED1F
MFKVLLIDDEKAIIEGLSAIISWSRLNCEVIGSAYNGQVGVEQAALLQPDIIVTDIRMPYVDGLQMIEAIQRTQPHVQFIILSGYSDFKYAQKGIELGIKQYVLKPVEEKELEASLAAIVQKLDKERQERMEIEKLKQLSSSAELMLQEQLF